MEMGDGDGDGVGDGECESNTRQRARQFNLRKSRRPEMVSEPENQMEGLQNGGLGGEEVDWSQVNGQCK